MSRLGWHLCSSLLLMLFFSSVAKGSQQIWVMDSIKTSETRSFVSHLQSVVWDADISVVEDVPIGEAAIEEKALIVVLGKNAFVKALRSERQIPILALFMSRTTYENIRKTDVKPLKRVSAIFSDADLNDQIALVTGLYNRPITVGVLYSTNTRGYIDELNRISGTQGYRVKFEYSEVTSGNDVYIAINSFKAKSVDALLAIPDNKIYNGKSFKGIVLSSHRNQQSVIGFSDNLVRAGALASVYYLPKHLAIEAGGILNTYFSNGYLGRERFAKNFNVAVNRSIARALNLYKNDPKELEDRIKKNGLFKDKAFEFVFIDSLPGAGV